MTALLAAAPAFADSWCPQGIAPAVERDRIIRTLSSNAELLAKSGGKRRSVGVPSAPPPLAVANFIDAPIAAKLAKDSIAPAPIAGDEEFLRRVHLDLTGTIPTAAQVQAFLADPSTTKRAAKIDELLASDAFVDRWTMWFGDLVQNVQFANNSREYYIGRNVYYNWIRDSIRAGKPYDQMVRDALAGEGMSFTSGVANYVVRQMQNNGPRQDAYDNLATHSAEKFLGIPLLCISCHGGVQHLESVNWWLRNKTRTDFWKMAAFFAQVQSRPVEYFDPNNNNNRIFQFNVTANALSTYRLNTTDGNKSPRQPAPGESDVVTPAFITTGETPRAGELPRIAYGRMLTADRQFARAAVNYFWREMFGLGLVEPVNAFDLSKLETQPTHPDLLEAMAGEFIAKGYNLRAMLRTIATSNTYQLSSRYPYPWNEAWVPYFARRYPRRLMAEVAFDAIATATNVPASFTVQGMNNVPKAMQLPDPLEGRRAPGTTFINYFGRGDRDDVMRTNDSSISQALALMNDQNVTTRVKRSTPNSTVNKLLAATSDPGTITDELYLATLSRRPSAAERQAAIDYLRAGTLAERTEDLQYALLNSLEFLFQ
ncbi:MAG TPA: DUF1549 domain-containing protein [Thermoanaerobaculia bacterium]|nr:DUF1549 domain-containing protein [Thermoanaerobaculia bacterium]